MFNYQAEIVANVDARGYRVKRDGIRWTDAQYAARQVCKLGEEFGELTWWVTWNCIRPYWHGTAQTLRDECKIDFDETEQFWANVAINSPDQAAAEAADMLVVLYNLADALGVDLNALALEKSRADVERGVR